jgi:hypothetical protein
VRLWAVAASTCMIAILGAWFALGCIFWLVRGQRVSRSMHVLQVGESS